MTYIEREYYNNNYSSVDILFAGDYIGTIPFNSPKFETYGDIKTYVDYEFEVEGNTVTLTIDITESTVLIVVEDENIDNYITGDFDLDEFDFAFNNIEEDTETSLKIPFYMPTLTYTNLASSIVYDIDRPNIVPLFDIDSIERFDAYKKDEIITFSHFLDIEFIEEVINEDVRTAAKEARKREAQIFGKGNQVTELPEKQYEYLQSHQIIEKYLSIENKDTVIPVLNWERGHQIVEDIKTILESFVSVAIRISKGHSSFNERLEDIYQEVDGQADNIYLIYDMSNNFADEQYQPLIEEAIKYFAKTIYLGAQVAAKDISLKAGVETNINFIFDNQPLEIFANFQKSNVNLFGYGDYCGFDRKTVTRAMGGRPTARVVLASVDDSKKLLVRRGWDKRDEKKDKYGAVVSYGLINSMNKLMEDIQQGALEGEESRFIDSEYDTDEALKNYYPDRPSPGTLKTMCLRHNYLSVVKNFVLG
ncbi:hypothetical protein WCX72_08965 [Sulfurimonas sp. HSL1-6]|uniref:hypothetical protein n=1 Tax=Thiomicrolovo immobilis TaxID=3131935 RepID=UPI0031F7524D